MTKELVCIVCPRSCRMTITSEGDELVVTGNTCKRGKEFAINEMTDPRRTVCTTVRTSFPSVPVLPVRVSGAIPKNKIFDLMHEVNRITISKRIGREEVIVPNILDLGVDLIATSNILKDENNLVTRFARNKYSSNP